MVKQRMSTADVTGETACLRQKLLGMRVANIYDVNPKTYIIKLSRSGEEGEKAHLVLESGTRFHTTQYIKEKADTPSNFTLKLRKHLRTRRLDEAKQLGVDRVVDFSFGTGEACYHLILELYAQGNVILTDANYEILTLLRSHRDDNKGISFMARHPYPIHSIRLRTPLDMCQLHSALDCADDKQTLRGALATVVVHGPAVCEHCILTAQLHPGRKPRKDSLGEPELKALFTAVKQWESWLDACETSAPEGFIAAKRTVSAEEGEQNPEHPKEEAPLKEKLQLGDGLVYESYDPLRLKQNEAQELLPFPTFDAALDEFYAKIEGQRAEQARRQQEQAALMKLEKIRLDQTSRAQTLEEEAREAEQKATVIEINAEAVDGAINAVRGALAQGLSWPEMERLIKDERDAGNPVASLIKKLSLDKNKITIELPDWVEDGLGDADLDSDASEDTAAASPSPTVMVEVDVDMNAHANARAWHGDRKARTVKQQKTIEANKKALAVADKKVQVQLSKVKAVTSTQQLRKPHWFEKFNWFVTSENHLVLSGRDAQQNELLVKRYLRKDDLYVHADLHGAATTIVRNNDSTASVPPFSISQAGQACVCRSQAWDAKIVTSAWWVHASQVSKTAPSGEYLPTGSFMVRGKKNFLPPHPLVMGLSFLFKLEESCIAGHLGERAPKTADEDAADSAAAEQEAADDAVDVPEDADDGHSDDEPTGRAAPADEAAGSAQRESSNALEAFLDSAPDPLRARRPSSNQVAAQASGRPASSAAPGQYSKYGLDAPQPASSGMEAEAEDDAVSDKEANGVGQADGSAPRRHLSAAERKALKKGTDTDANGASAASSPTDPELEAARKAERERRAVKAAAAEEAEAAAALARGKRSKLRRAREKYAHQDEEDRQLALEVLAPAGKKKSTKEKRELRKAKKRDTTEESTLAARKATPEELAAAGARLGPRAQAEAEERRAAEEAAAAQQQASSTEESDSAQSEAEQPEAALKAEGSRDAKEIAAILAEENVELLPEEDKEKLQELDSLTGQPRATDILLYAIPMCAPYSALQSYKLKVKMTPGSQRKGRAARQAADLLARAQDATAREKDLLKSVPETEVISAMIGNVKLAMPGLSKMVTEQRKGRKKKG
ncbi:hypothetical protein CVIRNUC_010166 [Coccomyxa viridis]|uniref:Nuclear export mediator factor NEMF n=1 Tax=Coccomyxa viridis TaxID=1274662 RepID=A0AAV1IJV0_9CHLO|nr:hypothetical protein CVIRNUC_010166 [Coccomyxa viridis]